MAKSVVKESGSKSRRTKNVELHSFKNKTKCYMNFSQTKLKFHLKCFQAYIGNYFNFIKTLTLISYLHYFFFLLITQFQRIVFIIVSYTNLTLTDDVNASQEVNRDIKTRKNVSMGVRKSAVLEQKMHGIFRNDVTSLQITTQTRVGLANHNRSCTQYIPHSSFDVTQK